MKTLKTLYLWSGRVGSILIGISFLNFNRFSTPSQKVRDIVSFYFYSSIASKPISLTLCSNISLYFSLSNRLLINLTHLTINEAVLPFNTKVKVANAAVLKRISTFDLSLSN